LYLRALGGDAVADADEHDVWLQPLQTLSGIAGAQLRIDYGGRVNSLDHPCIDLWLKQHGKRISHLSVAVDVSKNRLKLRDFADAAAPCRSIDLTVTHSYDQVLDLFDLEPVAGCLHHLSCQSFVSLPGSFVGASALNGLPQLTSLHLDNEDLASEEPWELLAKLTRLQELGLAVGAIGDPSPLSALTGLSHLYLNSMKGLGPHGTTPFSFSSLQPLSTLQQLEVLRLAGPACAATSLQGLAGLSNVKQLDLQFSRFDPGMLKSLEGICPGVTNISIWSAPDLVSLAGIEGCASLEKLSLQMCGVASLQPLRGLSNMQDIMLHGCSLTSLEGLCGMSLQSLTLTECDLLTQVSGVEHVPALKSLVLVECGLTSLQPLSQLRKGLQELKVYGCRQVQDEVLDLPHVQMTADVVVRESNVREVVLAGGVRRAVRACIDPV
jgi:Leucine-rich repeat (LRR) protein